MTRPFELHSMPQLTRTQTPQKDAQRCFRGPNSHRDASRGAEDALGRFPMDGPQMTLNGVHGVFMEMGLLPVAGGDFHPATFLLLAYIPDPPLRRPKVS